MAFQLPLLHSAGCSVGVKWQRRVVPVASEETLDTQEGGAAVSQGLQTGSHAVGRGRAVSVERTLVHKL